MTHDQLQYRVNANKSKALCLQMEKLIEEVDYHEKSLNYHSMEVVIYKISEIKLKLDIIWDYQIDLFYKIQNEFKIIKRVEIMKQLKLPKKELVYRE